MPAHTSVAGKTRWVVLNMEVRGSGLTCGPCLKWLGTMCNIILGLEPPWEMREVVEMGTFCSLVPSSTHSSLLAFTFDCMCSLGLQFNVTSYWGWFAFCSCCMWVVTYTPDLAFASFVCAVTCGAYLVIWAGF
jgi:hypothetical protein